MDQTPASRLRSLCVRRWWAWAGLGLALAGCGDQATDLRLGDLAPGERFYVTRIVTLERARFAAQLDTAYGYALLDSLRNAWGDSARPETLAAAPRDPKRAARVAALLVRVLAAEQDSLLLGSSGARLGAPLPDPAPRAAPPAPAR